MTDSTSNDIVIVFRNGDDETRVGMPRAAAHMSTHARTTLELLEAEDAPHPHEVYFEGVQPAHAAAVVDFMIRGIGASEADLDLLCSSVFSSEEMERSDHRAFFQALNAAHAMRVGAYFSRGTALIARLIRGKTVEEMRAFLRLSNDFTPEEEREVCAQNEWIFA